MISYKNLLLFISLIFFSLWSHAQALKDFPAEPGPFYDTMFKFLEETNSADAEALMAELKVLWTTEKMEPKEEEKMYKAANKFLKKRTDDGTLTKEYLYSASTSRLSDAQKKDIMKTCNSMLKKRMKAFPDFRNYLYALISFKLSSQSDESFRGWQSSIDKLLERANKYFAAYINGCNNLFAGNLLYLSSSTKWVASNSDYVFDFDSLPKIIFAGNTLICYAKKDSSVIKDTKGVYYPTLQKWVGKGGKVNFLRAGYAEDLAKAELSNYIIDVSGSDFVADSATFTFSKYFTEPLLGRYSDRVLADVTPENATYPRFDTYLKIIEIHDIVKDVDYVGGFSLQGHKVMGTGNSNDPAHLTFYLRNKPFLIASSNTFVIRPERITSDRTAVTLYLDTNNCNPHCDSIYHPFLHFKYITAERLLNLIRTEEGVGSSPFFDSYHKMDMYFEGLYWKIDEPFIEMHSIPGGTETKAHFESADFFKEYKFDKIQGIASVHPFSIIKKFTDKQKSPYIAAPDLAKFMKASDEQTRAMLMTFSREGYIIYNQADDNFFVTDRLYYYINAKLGKVDYDVIAIESTPVNEKNNAKLDLVNYDLNIFGVNRIQVSDSQNVSIIPKDRQITLKKNRDFDFSGRVYSGRFEYFGKNFAFDYDAFKINLDFVDSMRIKIPSGQVNEYGKPILVPVKTVVQYINGNLLIDDPGNKSGVKDFADYPIFNSFKDSYTFYDRSAIQSGVYKKENFYFHLVPFTIDSLNTFSTPTLALAGTFVSAGIFPNFEDSLKIQPDLSLGFVRNTPEEGFKVYGDKATYKDTIDLSHEGLRGRGELDYVTSASFSNHFIFYPDSMNSYVDSLIINKQGKPIEFPPVQATNVYEHWMPFEDNMHIQQTKDPFDFYNEQAFLTGSVDLTPKDLTGEGVISFVKADLDSKKFKFRETTFGADTSNLSFKSQEEAEFAFKTVNVNSEIDLVARTGLFKSNGAGSYVNFGVNQYICYMDQFKWYMDDGMLEMSSKAKKEIPSGEADKSNLNLEGSEFISTNASQDSLRWYSPSAKFYISENVIRAQQVQFILVADAIIYPDSGKVTIHKKAKMETLENAKITVNSTTRYHEIYNVTANITARKNYSGSGDYDYLDLYKKKQTIRFSKIQVDTTAQTYASSTIPDTTNFTLIPQISFKGDVSLFGSRQFLNFSGYGKLNMQCEGVSGSWFKFTSDIDPAEVSVPLEGQPVDDKNNPLSMALSVFNDSTSYIYSSLFAPKRKPTDLDLITPLGMLIYDKESNMFRVGSKEKLGNKTLPGNYMDFNDTKCTSYAEGKINLNAQLGQVKIVSPGTINNNMNNYKTEMDMLMSFDFFFMDDALKEMAENIMTVATLEPADNGRITFEKGMAEFVGKEKADKLITDLNVFGSFKKIPPELLLPLVLTEVHMEWNPDSRSFRSIGPISVGNILKHTINKKMAGQIEIEKKKNGDILQIYLEADPGNWYYFRYTKGVMEAVSSNEKFNTMIRNLKSDKRSAKTDKELGSYQFMISSERKKSDFLRKSAPEEKEDK